MTGVMEAVTGEEQILSLVWRALKDRLNPL
jgi:hypothetical protein